MAITVALAAYIAIDGLTSWLEGAQLLALWGILRSAVLLLQAPADSAHKMATGMFDRA